MMMKGDGTMMNIDTAKMRPVETIMSGPAASIVGGLALSGCMNGMIVDIGSTSTDIACIKNGMPPISKRGAVVLGKKTHVRTMDAHTIALGGDSHIGMDKDGNVKLGPSRSVPLATSSLIYPVLKDRMRKDDHFTYLIPHKKKARALSSNEEKVLDFVKANAPCKVSDISDEYPIMYTLPTVIEKLAASGNIVFTSLTPTDLMVITGRFDMGDAEASELGLEILSRKEEMSKDQVILKVMDQAVVNSGRAILEKVMIDEIGVKEFGKDSKRMMDAAVGKNGFGLVDMNLKLNVPIVGLGGPANAFLSSLRTRLDTEVIVPENHDIGNAIGTVRSKISETSHEIGRAHV
jgi:N-methylhydantoinase A/oxoprolinase/acetone carboxylase beta subunit